MHGSWGYSGTRCRVKKGFWQDEDRQGKAFLYFTDNKGQMWCAVQWDGDDDPDLFKAAGLEVLYLNETEWESVPQL